MASLMGRAVDEAWQTLRGRNRISGPAERAELAGLERFLQGERVVPDHVEAVADEWAEARHVIVGQGKALTTQGIEGTINVDRVPKDDDV